MQKPTRNLKEVVQYLSYTMEVISELANKRRIDNPEALEDIRKGVQALEVAVDYLKLGYAVVEKEENKKRNEEQEN